METERNQRTRQLFDPIAGQYDLLVEVLTFWQNRRWRRFLVSRLEVGPDDHVLDLCTGTGGVAIQIARRYGSHVVGLDLSENMLRRGRLEVQRAGLEGLITLVRGRAEQLSYHDESFDAVTFTYLLRYVDDVRATLSEVVRVLKPGGHLASLEFAVPSNGFFRLLWWLYTRAILPAAGSIVSRGWRRVGTFLGPSISEFSQRHSAEALRQMWIELGLGDTRFRHMSLGGGVVMWGTKNS